MQARSRLKLLVAAGIISTASAAMPPKGIHDGPVGLQDYSSLRLEHIGRRRHRDDPPKKTISDTPPTLTQESAKDVDISSQQLTSIRDGIKQEQLQRLHINLQDVPLLNLMQIIPQFMHHLPSNLISAQRYITDAASALLSLGLQSILGSQVFSGILCTPTSNDAEMAVCVNETVTKMSQLITTGTNILSLNFRVLSGGHLAKDALVRLNTIASNPLNKDIMKVLGCTAVLYITLMRESVPDETKILAGSIMTQITSLPIITDIPDTASGGFGRVNVVIPRPSRVQRADYDMPN
uniref:Membrane protein, putative n=1 Tax=Babesia bovis TaxID=5865 RepID=S6C9E0_BABBO|nr:membrane protein, putative [Babesia bovis]